MQRCGEFGGLCAALMGVLLLGAQSAPPPDSGAAPTTTPEINAAGVGDFRGFRPDVTGAVQSGLPGAPTSGAGLEGLGDAAQTRTESARGRSSLHIGPPVSVPMVAGRPQRQFPTGELAIAELSRALRMADFPALEVLFGPEAKDLLFSGDPIADNATRRHFLHDLDQASRMVPAGGDRLVLETGNDHWPFPIPLVRDREGWRFDTPAGLAEVIDRRIGRNELAVIKVSLAYVDAQREYASADRDGDGVLEYAQQFNSTADHRDGLYWPTNPGEAKSPLGPLVAASFAEGYTAALRPSQPTSAIASQPTPGVYFGYRYKILTRQGPPNGKRSFSYVVDGHMTRGFAMVAYPALYRLSGVKTFIVNQQGVVYERDLGPNTQTIAEDMTTFNPDPRWTAANMASRGMMIRPRKPPRR